MSPYITPPSKRGVTTCKDCQEVARSTLVKGIESKMAALWCIWILWEDPDRKKVKDSGESKRAEPPLWSQ
jgi:hypothetical protein